MKPIVRTSISFLFFILCCTGCGESADESPDNKLTALQIELPQVPKAIGSYVDATRAGNLIFLSGKGPRQSNGEYIKGKVGTDLAIEEGYAAARLTALNQLAVLKELGLLNKVRKIVKVNGYVNSSGSFCDQPKVVDGFSDLMLEIFGEAGRHSRTSVSVSSLPMNMAVEVEMVVEVE